MSVKYKMPYDQMLYFIRQAGIISVEQMQILFSDVFLEDYAVRSILNEMKRSNLIEIGSTKSDIEYVKPYGAWAAADLKDEAIDDKILCFEPIAAMLSGSINGICEAAEPTIFFVAINNQGESSLYDFTPVAEDYLSTINSAAYINTLNMHRVYELKQPVHEDLKEKDMKDDVQHIAVVRSRFDLENLLRTKKRFFFSFACIANPLTHEVNYYDWDDVDELVKAKE